MRGYLPDEGKAHHELEEKARQIPQPERIRTYMEHMAEKPHAAGSPQSKAVAEYAADGGPVVGICNGFQVLTEAGLLPGALQQNAGLTFVCDTVDLEVVSTRSVLTNQATTGQILRINRTSPAPCHC